VPRSTTALLSKMIANPHDLKTGAKAKGAVALWLDLGTVAHFRNLTVTRE
jgi:hypothetical protein